MMKRFTVFSGIISLWLLFAGVHISAVQAQDVVSDLLGRINQLRAEQGLPAYRLNNTLNAAARNQAGWMANTGQVSHTQSDGSSVRDRAQAAGYSSSWVSENIYMGTLATTDSAWQFWLNSPIHYSGLTSPNYQDIGIATASGEGGQSFVLVFGNPGGNTASVPRTNNSTGSGNSAESSGPPPPPPYFKGVDAQGYILHEIQPGHTMGDIALIYGYSWDDIPQILASNDLTQDDQRNLVVGEIIKVPPQDGTYTPTPAEDMANSSSAESTVRATEPASVPESNTDSSDNVDDGILPTPTPDSNAPSMPATPTPQNGLVQPQTYTQPTATLMPTIAATQLPATRSAMQIAPVAPLATVTRASSDAATDTASVTPAPVPQTPPMWLILAIGIQVVVLSVASFEYVRRN